MTKANEMQVGGNFYKTNYEHWDWILNIGAGYLVGCATKYISRWRKKNGLEDLQKALHYVDKLEEAARAGLAISVFLHQPDDEGRASIVREVGKFTRANSLSVLESTIILNLAIWTTVEDISGARELLKLLIEDAETEASEAEAVPASDSNKHAEHSTGSFSLDQGDVSDRLSNFDDWGNRIRPRS